MNIELEQTDIDRIASEVTHRVLKGLKSSIITTIPPDDTILTVKTLATYLMTTPKWVYNHVHELPHFQVDGLLRFKKSEINKFLAMDKK